MMATSVQQPRPGSALPPLPTRKEIVEFVNAGGFRTDPITVRVVKRWDEQGWIRRHPAYQWPARYIANNVVDFLNGEVETV